MAVQIIFSFDCEDYITPEAADAERWWALALAKHGLPGCLCVVGELARALRERGRQDVVRAMARHEISYHSDNHSAHPTHAEYLDGMEWDAGVAAVLEREACGIQDLVDLFGQWPASYCKPGSSWGPPVPEAMRRVGIPMLSDSPFEWSTGQPIWYGNMLGISYHTAFDDYFGPPDPTRVPRMKADFERLLERHRGGTLVMYTHPCRLVTAEFWDAENFAGGVNTPRERWRPAPLRPAAEIAALKRDFDAFLEWVAARDDVTPTTYREFHSQHRQPAGAWVSRSELLQAAAAAGDPPAPVKAVREWLSPAEILALVAASLVRYADTSSLPEAVPVRRPLGPTAPQPPSPPAGDVPALSLLEAARAADRVITETGALPARLALGGTDVGPNAFLQAARTFLRKISALPASGGPAARDAPGAVQLRVSGERAALAARDDFAAFRYRDSWPVFPPEFEAPHLAEMARWQAWSGKPATRG